MSQPILDLEHKIALPTPVGTTQVYNVYTSVVYKEGRGFDPPDNQRGKVNPLES